MINSWCGAINTSCLINLPLICDQSNFFWYCWHHSFYLTNSRCPVFIFSETWMEERGISKELVVNWKVTNQILCSSHIEQLHVTKNYLLLVTAEQVFSPTSICAIGSWLSSLEYSTASRGFPSLSSRTWFLTKWPMSDLRSSHIASCSRWTNGPSLWKKLRNFLNNGSTDRKASWDGKVLSRLFCPKVFI